MKTALVVVLIAAVPVMALLALLRQILFFLAVAPGTAGKGMRFWVNTLGGGSQDRSIKLYIQSLPRELRSKWPNWYLAKANAIILVLLVLWIAGWMGASRLP